MSDKRSILIVDDDESFRSSLAAFLAKDGFTVFTADSGEAAQLRLHESWIDLVISDVEMPGGNGIQLALAIRAARLGVPIFLMSGSTFDEENLVSLDVTRFFSKPFSSSVLLRAVRETLGAKKAG